VLSPRVVVTGGNGFVGSHLTRMLKEESFEVLSIDCEPNTNPISGVEYLVKDLNGISNHQFERILKGATLIHLAAISSSPVCEDNPDLAINVNIKLFLKLIQNANISNTPIIFASSEWVYPDSATSKELEENFPLELTNQTNLYSMSKVVGEWMLKRYCQNYQILRFGIVYGERKSPQSAIEKVIFDAVNYSEVQVGNFLTARRFIHVEDLCSGIIQSLITKSQNAIFNISGEKLASLKEVIYEYEDLFDLQIEKSEIGHTPSIRNPIPFSFYSRHNWKPKIELREGILRLANFYMANQKGEN
jgi:UDP-glucose 4-epimerase